MSSNRKAWILVSLVVVVVALLVVRTMRNDARMARERTASLTQERPKPRSGAEPSTSAGTDKAPAERRVSSVERAKAILKEKGYYDGPIDANYDQAVADAVKRFQKDHGMEQNGYLNERTYTALGIELKKKR